MPREEQVLVIETKILEQVGAFHGLAFDLERYLPALFAPGAPRFMPRSLAESDPSYKQIIPYVIMTHNGKYLSYVRGKRAGETRLVGLRSLGIGGHINPADDHTYDMPLFEADFYEAYTNAVRREVAEEVTLETPYSNLVAALLNDDTNEVGRVHLGIVHYWILDQPKVAKREQMITQMDFMAPAELMQVKDTLETWSGLCLEKLDLLKQSAVPLHSLLQNP